MPKRISSPTSILILMLVVTSFVSSAFSATYELKRAVAPKPVYTTLPSNLNTDDVVIKLKEGMGQPEFDGQKFLRTGPEWDVLNNLISSPDKAQQVKPRFDLEKEILDEMRAEAIERSGVQVADLTLYHNLRLSSSLSAQEKVDKINAINELDIVEIAYFPPVPEIATLGEEDKIKYGLEDESNPNKSLAAAPDYQAGQYYLNPAPQGINAYYAWGFPGGTGANIKVIDIEGNWIETHEDLHGGTDTWHIAGNRINDPGWWNHGTAVLGEIAADSNGSGMTGIAYDVDLGTVSIGSMSTAQALTTCINNSDTGDVFLIELHAAGPDASGNGQDGYVCMEYWQENFDVILQASALGRIVVEAAGNGAENFDDFNLYGNLFDPSFRFSGAIMVGASCSNHAPASFTNYGQRVDVHGYGCWDVYTLAYGDLFGTGNNNNYTSSFSGTSSASPIITGACAVLEGLNKANHGRVLDHNEIRYFLTTYSTPQASSFKNIGPLPDLAGAVDEIVGVSFVADTQFGWVPLSVNFDASSALSVDTWTWSFGDGDSAYIQSPSHVYNNAGMYTVGVEIDAAGDIRQASKDSYIIALADTMKTDSILTHPGEDIEVVIYANNTIPVSQFQIPIEYSGSLQLTIDSISTIGCLTENFENQIFLNYDSFNKRITYQLTAGTAPFVQPTSGPILKVYFSVSPSAVIGQGTTIFTDGYNSYLPHAVSPLGSYNFVSENNEVYIGGCCTNIRGNADADSNDQINISDLVFLVDFSFGTPPGPAPECFEEADVDASNELNIADIVYLVDYSFGSPAGPAPLSCF